jgi:2,3-bisphosphoglycerate-independent phosphoglycerate mutase
MKKKYQPLVLLILDGWGLAPKSRGNAIELAKKPNFDKLWKKYPHTKLAASGKCAGLPNHDAGNSEAGHMNIGAGRTVLQDSVIINRAIEDGTFFDNIALQSAADHVKANKSRLHIMGLISDNGSPHSSLEHLLAVIKFCKLKKINKVYLHLFTDGRDSPQRSSYRIIKRLLDEIHDNDDGYNNFELVSLVGRFYSMDRGKNWERTAKAYDCLVHGRAKKFNDYEDAIEHSYNSGKTDEYLEPAIIDRNRSGFENTRIKDNDAIIFFNLRSDRARQLTKCFVQKDFNEKNPGSFKRPVMLKNLLFCAFTDFGPDLSKSLVTAYPGAKMIGTLPFCLNGFRQMYIAETEKYAHVTYFINGGYPDPVNREKRVRVPSPVIDSYADKPEMAVYEITKKVIEALKKKSVDFITVNFANPDMVGHTGDLAATIKAVEHVDVCLGKVYDEIKKHHGLMLITADHGNAEKMIEPETGEIFVEHTTNPVPLIFISDDYKKISLKNHTACLSDIAPTIYDYLGILPNNDVTGISLLKRKK